MSIILDVTIIHNIIVPTLTNHPIFIFIPKFADLLIICILKSLFL